MDNGDLRKCTNSTAFLQAMKSMGSFDDVKSFWRYVNAFTDVCSRNYEARFDIRIFRDGVLPCWEHPENASGGYLQISCDNDNCIDIFREALLLIAGDTFLFNKDVSGCVFVSRKNRKEVQIWLGACPFPNSTAVTRDLAQILRRSLRLPTRMKFCYCPHEGNSIPLDFSFEVNENAPKLQNVQNVQRPVKLVPVDVKAPVQTNVKAKRSPRSENSGKRATKGGNGPKSPTVVRTQLTTHDPRGGPLRQIAVDLFERYHGLNGREREDFETLARECFDKFKVTEKSVHHIVLGNSYKDLLGDLRSQVPNYPVATKAVKASAPAPISNLRLTR